MVEWRAQMVQFVWFTPSAAKVDAEALYQTVWGDAPDTVQRNRVPNSANPFLAVCSGSYEEAAASVQVQPGRIDLIVAVEGTTDTPPWSMKMLDAIGTADMIATKIAESRFTVPDTIRQSVVMTLMKPVDAYEEGARILYDCSGFDPGMSDVSEIIVQLNRRMTLDSDPTVMANRLVRYQNVAFQTLRLDTGFPNYTSVPMNEISYAATINLDFNTVPTGATFEGDKQRAIWIELLSSVFRVAETGELSRLGSEV